jgi:hypothetical protein
MASGVTAAGARGQAGLPNMQAMADAEKKKKDEYAAKVKRQKDRKAAAEAAAKNQGGAFGNWLTQTQGGALPAAGEALKYTGLVYVGPGKGDNGGSTTTANKLMNDFYNWSDAQKVEFDSKLRKLGIYASGKTMDPNDRETIYKNAVGRASTFYSLSAGKNLVDGSVDGTLLAFKGTAGSTGAPNLPDRRIENLSDATINAIIDNVSQAKLKRDINDPAERSALLKKIKDQLAQGTVTTTKKVKNAKTGKWENVTETSGVTSQDIQLQLGKEFETSHAQDYQLNKALEFNDFLTKVMSRGV